MLLGRIMVLLVFEHFQCSDQSWARILGINHRIDIARLRGLERIGESPAVIFDHFLACLSWIVGLLQRIAKYNINRAVWPMTAISPVGNARLTSPRRCLLDITM